jgi:deoxyadenosine/deoxycytidine kinase
MAKLISIEGNIGSGKSTILRSLKAHFSDNEKINQKILFLQEPVDEWENIKDKDGNTILKKFYENQKDYSFAFQMMAYISRLSLLKREMDEHPDAIIITERCLNTDRYVFAKMLYDDGLIEDVEYQIYLTWFEHFFDINKIQKLVYLKTDPKICLERVNKRMREGESTLTHEYLEKCHKYHSDMITNTHCDVLQIDSNVDTDMNTEIENKWIDMIKYFILN